MADQREAKRVLGLDAGQACSSIQPVCVRQFTGLVGNRAGDLVELFAAR